MADSRESLTGDGQKPLLRRSSWTESMFQRQRLSSPVFHMQNSVKKPDMKTSVGQAGREADSVDTSVCQLHVPLIDTTGSILTVDFGFRRRRSRDRRLASSPSQYNSLHITTTVETADECAHLSDRQQIPLPDDGETSDEEVASSMQDDAKESLYCTMLPTLINKRNWKNDYSNLHATDDHSNNGITAAFVLNEISQSHLICNMCNKRFTRPKALGCLHSFCSSCLEGLLRNCNDAPCEAITCPICREVTKLPTNGLAGVRDNILLVALLEDVTKLEGCLQDQKLGATLDEVKKRQKSAKDYQKLCLVRQESTGPVDSRQRASTSEQSSTQSPQRALGHDAKTCPKHPHKDLTLFCKNCQKLICRDCTASDHHASQHGYVDAASAVDVCRSTLQSMVSMVRTDKKKFTQAASSAAYAHYRLDIMTHYARIKISRMEEREIARVRAQGDRLWKELAEMSRKCASEIEAIHKSHCSHAQRASQTLDNIQHALTRANSLEMLKRKQRLFDEIKTVINKEVIASTHDLSFIDFQADQTHPPSKLNLGRILLKENWELKREFGPHSRTLFKQVGFVAVYSNGNLAVADMETWKMTLVSGKPHGRYLQELNDASEEKLTRPYAIAINTDDELIVIDNSRLRVFDKDMKFLRRVHTTFPELPDYNSYGNILSCLAVDKNNRIAVGIRGKEIISLYEQDGTFIRTVPAEMIDTQLAISKQQRFVYSNYEHRKIVSMDFGGQRVFCVDTDDKKPTGVCCDNAGYIYVAMHTDTVGECGVHQYNPNGVAIGCVITKLDNPLGIIFTREDELVVADKYSVKIYHRT